MRISIVVDNYNYEQYVAAAVESALAQTWEDTEVIVVDDGSIDRSMDVIERFAGQVRIVEKENGGQASAFAAAMEHLTGDAVIFLDADDLIDRTTAERVARAFAEEPGASRVQWAMQTIDATGAPSGPVVPNPRMMPSGDLRDHVLRFRTHVWPAQSGNAYATEILRTLFPIPDAFTIGCDLYFAELTALLGPVRSLAGGPGGSYRVHGSNNWTTATADVAYLHKKIAATTASHAALVARARSLGIPCPEDPGTALDVAFACARLASLRMDPVRHPIPADRRAALAVHGIRSAIAHPHHTARHKLKRVAWIVATASSPAPVANHLVRRFYFRPTG